MGYNKVAIIGTGLIGGSIGKALIAKKSAREVIGVCRRESSRRKALREKAVMECFVNDYEKALKNAELIIIATPVETVKEILKKISMIELKPGVIVTDVSSTKKSIVDFASGFSDKYIFIGAHPLAGSEKNGVEYASADLFHDSVCILTPGEDAGEDVVSILRHFWQELGAKVRVLSPQEHDFILACTSHLPHVAAYALVGAISKDYLSFVSTGFKDTTRIASSDPLLWAEIFLTNRENILKTLKRYKGEIVRIEDSIREGDREKLIEILKQIKGIRDEII
jgi:prephenate dehydrogenase